MSNNEQKSNPSFFQRNNGKIALGAAFLIVSGMLYDVIYNETELTQRDTGAPAVYQAGQIKPLGNGRTAIYLEQRDAIPYMFRTTDEQAANIEVGDCFRAVVTGVNVAVIDGSLDKLRAREIIKADCPQP